MKSSSRAAFVIVLLMPALCAAQTSLPNDAATQMVRAAGMPLNDGTLAPGILIVRVVEGAFTSDIRDQLVELEVAGGTIESARTGPDGRAQFAHLPIGARVRAWTVVAGERLESDSLDMPAENGVRVLLVAGADAGSPLSSSGASTAGAGEWPAGPSRVLPPNHPPLPDAPFLAPSVPASANGEGVLAVRAVLLTATIFALGIVLFRRPRRR